MSGPQLIAGRFEIADPERDLLGRGGVGDVYRARDTYTGDLVAVKALRPEVVAASPDAIARFTREGEALREKLPLELRLELLLNYYCEKLG